MPLTPLHLAAGLPVRKHISMKAFIAVNLLIDVEPVAIAIFNMDAPLHGITHTLAGASFLGLLTWLLGWGMEGGCRRWFAGAFLGAWSHLVLDALVHADVEPFWPLLDGNPLFLDAHLGVSILCALVLCYYLAVWIGSLRIGEMLSRW